MTDPPPLSRRRISVTKLQRESVAALELFSLCDTMTSDGRLSDEEIVMLRQWTDDYATADLPARDHVRSVIDRVLADGVVTAAERDELYLAVEAVLPPDLRAPVQGRRREVERAELAKEKAQREEAATWEREQRERNAVFEAWNFMVAGVRHEGRPAIIRGFAKVDADVFLHRDPSNPFSRNAVAIQLKNGMQIGFVPERDAVQMAPLLDAGHPYIAFVTKILTGGRSPIPVIQADLYRTEATHPELIRPGSEPALIQPPVTRSKGCLATALLVVGSGIAAAFAVA